MDVLSSYTLYSLQWNLTITATHYRPKVNYRDKEPIFSLWEMSWDWAAETVTVRWIY